MQFLLWMIGGLVAGWFTGKLMASHGRDLIMDMVMGIAGAIAGGFLFAAAHVLVRGAMIYTDLCALTGAVLLTFLARQAGGSREQTTTN